MDYSKEQLEIILNNLINHDNDVVRKAVAEQGYGLDILVDDKEPTVRAAALAKQAAPDATSVPIGELCRYKHYIEKLINLDTTNPNKTELKTYSFGRTLGHLEQSPKRNITTVNALVHDNAGRPMVEEVLKTESGLREVPISPTLRKELSMWGEWYGTEGFLFTEDKGKPLAVGAINWTWHHIRTACEEFDKKYAKNFTAHILRHTFITRLFEAGLDIKEIQTLAGHKDVATTLGVYTHFDKACRQENTFSKVRNILEGLSTDEEKVKEPIEKVSHTVVHLPLPMVVNE